MDYFKMAVALTRAQWPQRKSDETTHAETRGKVGRALSALAETPVGADNVLTAGFLEGALPRAVPSSFSGRAGTALRCHGGHRAGSVVRRARLPIPSSPFVLPSLLALLGVGAQGARQALRGAAMLLHWKLANPKSPSVRESESK